MRGTRRAHRKSRTGCQECKRRRVKCDEARPQCRLCLRFSIDCVYPSDKQPEVQSPFASAAASETSPSGSASVERYAPVYNLPPIQVAATPSSSSPSTPWMPPIPLPHDVQGQSPTFSLKEMTLLHQWSVTTSLAVFQSVDGAHLWQHLITRIALRHPFVLYGMLSLSCLHIAHLDPSQRNALATDAAEYHNKAINGFHEAANQLQGSQEGPAKEDLAIAMFISAMLNLPYVFAMYGDHGESKEQGAQHGGERISGTLGSEWIPIMRGTRALLGPINNKLETGPLREIVHVPGYRELELGEHAVSAEDACLLNLKEIWTAHNNEDREVYNHALEMLRKACAWAAKFTEMRKNGTTPRGYSHEWSSPWIWIHEAPEKFFSLLQQRQPPALIMFAYFGVLLHQLDHYWWIQGWGQSVVNAVGELLGPYWQKYLEYPRQAVTASTTDGTYDPIRVP